MLRIIIGIFLLASFSSVHSQNESECLTPKSCVYTHLYYLQDETYSIETAVLAFPEDADSEDREKAAIRLKQIFDGKGLFVNVDKIPDQPNWIDSTTGNHIFVLFDELPEVYLIKHEDKWQYSPATVEMIPSLHAQVYPFGSEWLVSWLGNFGSSKFLGIKTWQWVGLVLLVIVHLIVFSVLLFIIKAILRKTQKSGFGKRFSLPPAIDEAGKPIALLFTVLIARQTVPMLQLPIKASALLHTALQIGTTVFAVLIALRVINVFTHYYAKVAEKTESTLDDQLLPVVEKIAKVVVVIIGLFFILDALNINIAALLAGISIGGLALALAAQDTVKNFIGSVMIFLDKPFQIGDMIEFSGTSGTVEEVGVRSTRLRTPENTVAYVPNGTIANTVLNNYGLRIYRRWRTSIGLTYDTPTHLIDAFCEGVAEIIEQSELTKKDNYQVKLDAFGPSSLDIIVHVFFDVESWGDYLAEKHHLMLQIMKLAENLGVRFAYPTSTLFVEEVPGQKTLTPQSHLTEDEAKAVLEKQKKGIL